MNNKLSVVAVEQKQTTVRALRPKTHREATQARFEREWHRNPSQFSSDRNIKEKERIARTLDFIQQHVKLEKSLVADLGCGQGTLSKRLRDFGASIDAVDIAKNALSQLSGEESIKPVHACIPNTILNDSHYDLVVCTELIGHLPSRERRLCFNELSRLVKRDGFIVFSTSLDIHSNDALEQLILLAETELEILDCRLSYHGLYLRLCNLLETPFHFYKASQDNSFKKAMLQDKHSIWKLWFKVNSSPPLNYFWGLLSLAARPILKRFKNSRSLLLFLEKFAHRSHSLSHIIFLAKRKPL
jgi:2-polyprenyl-3-methyl-5-hydroxy-6-metoxy-1,4-benzoquinol methylase